jgi:hypothetical protein
MLLQMRQVLAGRAFATDGNVYRCYRAALRPRRSEFAVSFRNKRSHHAHAKSRRAGKVEIGRKTRARFCLYDFRLSSQYNFSGHHRGAGVNVARHIVTADADVGLHVRWGPRIEGGDLKRCCFTFPAGALASG